MEFQKVSDNNVHDFHARMADGRAFTDYRSNCILNNQLANDKNSWEYRYYLTNNGSTIIDKFNKNMETKVRCTTCKTNTVLPVKNVQNCKKGICSISQVNKDGLGLDRLDTYFQ